MRFMVHSVPMDMYCTLLLGSLKIFLALSVCIHFTRIQVLTLSSKSQLPWMLHVWVCVCT